MPPPASHYVRRASWLRAAVLGANDGIISTASLIVGVAAAHATIRLAVETIPSLAPNTAARSQAISPRLWAS